MKPAKHTAGPWAIRGPAGVDNDFAICSGGKIIAEAWGRVSESDYPNARANAGLIAASPDLLLALTKLVSTLKCVCAGPVKSGECSICVSEKAIAKATGGAEWA